MACSLTLNPVSIIDTTVWPGALSLTVAQVIFEVSSVSLSSWPDETPFSLHFVFDPFTVVLLAIGPDVETSAVEQVVLKLAHVR